MPRFVQIHLITPYPLGNPNRDDLGRPKSSEYGGVPRLRISSQCLKRAWRTSKEFEETVQTKNATRTRELVRHINEEVPGAPAGYFDFLAKVLATTKEDPSDKSNEDAGGLEAAEQETEGAEEDALSSAGVTKFAQTPLMYLSEGEIGGIVDIARGLANKQDDPFPVLFTAKPSAKAKGKGKGKEEKETATDTEQGKKVRDAIKAVMGIAHQSADLAMFGRMLSNMTEKNVEAAVQVSHAMTIQRAESIQDYFVAMDDLSDKSQQGAAHIGHLEAGSGSYYTYICADSDLLVRNLSGKRDLAVKAIQGVVKAAATVTPKGKQNSFATRVYATHILVEMGDKQPRCLTQAFLKPDHKADPGDKMLQTVKSIERAYGKHAEESIYMSVNDSESATLQDILDAIKRWVG